MNGKIDQNLYRKMAMNAFLSVISLKINGLNLSTTRYRVAGSESKIPLAADRRHPWILMINPDSEWNIEKKSHNLMVEMF